MKKIFSFVALFVGVGMFASAQDNPSIEKKDRPSRGKFRHEQVEKKNPEEIAKVRTERLDKELRFTDKQRAEVYAYNLEQVTKFKERAEIKKKEREQAREEMKIDREKFKNILTPEQRDILASKAKSNRSRMNREGHDFRGRKNGKYPMRHKTEKAPGIESNSNS
jgi:Spy/CpxP family protein refolding chaperone